MSRLFRLSCRPSHWVAVFALGLALSGLSPTRVEAHGGVVLDEDLCLINVGFYQAHFTVFQPLTRQHEQHCEDLPDTGESIFVLEYLHDGLGELGVDFRIITNTTGMGRFAGLDDVENIPNLEAVTVFYQPPVYEPDVFAILHQFDEPGEFIGVVTARHNSGREYTAVFPFEVGFEINDYADYLIYVIGLGALLIWIGPLLWGRVSRKLTQSRLKHRHTGSATPCTLLLPLPPLAFALATVLAGAMAPATHAQDQPAPVNPDAERSSASRTISVVGEHFQLQAEPLLEPLRINVMHSWKLTVLDQAGQAVSHAAITVTGGMPLHDHGLPTAPGVQPTTTTGEYHMHGVKFHMRGAWEFVLEIRADGRTDTLIVPLDL